MPGPATHRQVLVTDGAGFVGSNLAVSPLSRRVLGGEREILTDVHAWTEEPRATCKARSPTPASRAPPR